MPHLMEEKRAAETSVCRFMNLIVLLGGRSRRMGICKCRQPLGGAPLYTWALRRLQEVTARQILVTGTGLLGLERTTGHVVVHDLISDAGPLAGIHAGLTASETWLNFVVAGDMPFVSPLLASAMGAFAARHELDILYLDIDGRLEPLFAVYSKRVEEVAWRLLAKGCFSVRGLIDSEHLNVHAMDRRFAGQYDEQLVSLFNVNTPEDLVVARKMLCISEMSRQEERV